MRPKGVAWRTEAVAARVVVDVLALDEREGEPLLRVERLGSRLARVRVRVRVRVRARVRVRVVGASLALRRACASL